MVIEQQLSTSKEKRTFMKLFKILIALSVLSFLTNCSPSNRGHQYTNITSTNLNPSPQSSTTAAESIAVATPDKSGICEGLANSGETYSESTEQKITSLLSTYVTPLDSTDSLPNGFVKYQSWFLNAKDRQSLCSVLDAFANTKVDSFSTNDQKKAFYINAYNIMTIELILSNYLEIQNENTEYKKSIRNVKGSNGLPLDWSVWDAPTWTIAGEELTLNQVEKDILIPMKDARIHFAVNCASVGCPPLLNQAFASKTLDIQLDETSQFYVNQQEYVSTDNKALSLSQIFKWYANDFANDTSGKYTDVKSFIAHYIINNSDLSNEVLNTDPKKEIKYYDYNWGLNEKTTIE